MLNVSLNETFPSFPMGARCTSVLGVFAPRLVKQRPWYVLSSLWDGTYIKTLLVVELLVTHIVAAVVFSVGI